MLNRINIECNIRKIANDFFTSCEITESEIEMFINEIIIFVDNEFDSYIRNNEKELIHFVLYEKKKEAFNDFSTGYVRKMQKWIEDNPIQIRRIEIPVEDIVENLPNKSAIKKALIAAGIGTIITIGISFFAPTLLAIIAEFLALGIAYRLYKKYNNSIELQNLKPNLEDLKEKIVVEVVNDITCWLDKAQSESDKLWQSYK